MKALQALIRREVAAAWQHRWSAIAVAWVICLAGWTFVYTIPNSYEASARLYVDTDAVLTPLLKGIAVDSQLAQQLDVLQRTLLSRPNLEKVIAKTDLDLQITGPADLEQLVTSLSTSIRVVPQTHNLFAISYRNASPKLAFDVVQSILSLFVENKTGNNRSEMENAQNFLQQQIDNYERQLRAAEQRRAEFRTKYIDLLPSDTNGGVSGLDTARSNVRAIQGQIQDATAARDTLLKELAETPAMIAIETDGGGGGSATNSALVAAERNLADLRLRYTENHPDVVAAKAQVAQLRAQGPSASDLGAVRPASRPRTTPNPIYEQLKIRVIDSDTSLASLQRRLGEAVRDRDRLEEIARGAPQLIAQMTNLNRDYDVLRKNYEELLARREQMRLSVAADADADKIKLQIIDPPQVPQIPVAPKRVLLLSGVLLAGLAGGAGLALLLVQFDRSFHTIDDLRDLGLPVVGGISLFSVAPTRGRLTAVFMFSISILLLVAIYSSLVYRLTARGTGSI